MKYGYARCSTNEDKQDIQRQIRELKASGADEIVFEYEHGDAKVKRNLQMLLDTAREGDTIITLEVSRLSRSTQQLCLQIVGSITINCHNGQADPMSEAFLQMAGVFSQLELAMIRARVKSGMANAKANGFRFAHHDSSPYLPSVNLNYIFCKIICFFCSNSSSVRTPCSWSFASLSRHCRVSPFAGRSDALR